MGRQMVTEEIKSLVVVKGVDVVGKPFGKPFIKLETFLVCFFQFIFVKVVFRFRPLVRVISETAILLAPLHECLILTGYESTSVDSYFNPHLEFHVIT